MTPVALPDPPGVTVRHVESAREMLRAVEAALPADLFVAAAAVADWRVAAAADTKLKKGAGGPPTLVLTENPDILAHVAGHPTHRPGVVIGFAAETDDLLANASAKLRRKGCDVIVANDVSPAAGTFGSDRNAVTIVEAAGATPWPALDKSEVAARLVRLAAQRLGERSA